MDTTEFTVFKSATLIEAMSIIEQGASQIALVVDEQQKLLGTLTDGDIRRGLLHGATLDTPSEKLMNSEFSFARTSDEKSKVLEMMRNKELSQIPVIDDHGRVVNLFLRKDLQSPPYLLNTVVIMAGGKGTRLYPQTKDCPKPMLLIDGKPILEILLEQCIASGFHKFYISVNYLKDQIIEYFQDGNAWDVSINYLVEDYPLGTAGSLKLLPESIESPFLVMNGDVLTRLNLRQLINFHDEHKAAGTLCVREYTTTVPFGVVETDGVRLLRFQEKPTFHHLINAGVYVINPSLLSLLQKNKYTDMPTLLQDAQRLGHNIAVCPIHEYWIDIGRPDTLRQADEDWSKKM